MSERSPDELLHGVDRPDPKQVEALREKRRLPLKDQVEASYQGTCVVERFYEEVLIPFRILRPTKKEEVARTLILRTASALKSLALMNNSHHFQTAMGAARTIFELMVSLDALSREDGDALAAKLIAFVNIQRYQDGQKIVEYEERRRRGGLSPATPESALKNIQRDLHRERERVKCLRRQYFPGLGDKRIPQWAWSGQSNLRELVDALGGRSQEFHYTQYSRLSLYAHGSSLMAMHSLSTDDLQCLFFIAHDVARACAVAAAVLYAKIVRLDDVQGFRAMIDKL